MTEPTIEPTLDSLAERLRVLHRETRRTPLFNPVFQLSLDISRALEGGAVGIEDLAALVDELEARSLDARAQRLRNLLQPDASSARLAELSLLQDNFEDFRSFWERPHMHAVFTAHPTFLLTSAQGNAVARAVASGETVASRSLTNMIAR
jgi:phosphoenolpyruvate carboxylase